MSKPSVTQQAKGGRCQSDSDCPGKYCDDGGWCRPFGKLNLKCGNQGCDSGLYCETGYCVECGDIEGAPCCEPPNQCSDITLVCGESGKCEMCGIEGNACCDGIKPCFGVEDYCDSGRVCASSVEIIKTAEENLKKLTTTNPNTYTQLKTSAEALTTIQMAPQKLKELNIALENYDNLMNIKTSLTAKTYEKLKESAASLKKSKITPQKLQDEIDLVLKAYKVPMDSLNDLLTNPSSNNSI